MENFLPFVLGSLVAAVLWMIYKIYIVRSWNQRRGKYVDPPTAKHFNVKTVENRVQTAQRATRWSSFFYSFTQRAKFLIMFSAATLLAGFYVFVPVNTLLQEVWRFVFSALMLSGLGIGLSYWHVWAEQQERRLARQIHAAEEQLLLSYGVVTRQAETGFYTRDFLIHMLETFLSRVGQSLPLACLMLEIRGLADFRQQHGAEKAAEVLTRAGQMLFRSARPYDLVAYYGNQRLTLILLRYPAHMPIRNRFMAEAQRRVLDEVNQTYGCHLELVWSRANLPNDAPTPLQLLSRVSSSLDQVLRV